MDPSTPFVHASEAEMARILDFYAVRWEYEPRTFPILWNLEGDVVESFAPDFYLPDLDLYLEMTTLRQRLVRKKNRKLRRLRELYPGVNIKLFYARDFRALMLKYGKFALHDGLSGSSGQVPSPYASIAPDLPLADLPRADLPPEIAAIVGADSLSDPLPASGSLPLPATSPTPGGARRRRRPATTVGADEAVV